MQIDNLVTVESLQALFSSYGTVLDVSIKRSTIDKSTKFQSGFGFIHYSSQQDGIAAAFQAAKTLYDERIENVNYTCKISHALEKFLTSAHAHAHAHAHAATRTLMGPPSSTPKGPAANKSRADPARRYDSNPSPSPGGGRCVQMQMQMQPHRHLDRDRDRDSDRDNRRMGSHGQQTAAAGLLPVDRSFDAELSPSQQMQMQCMPPPPPPYSPVIRQRPSHTPQHLQPSNDHRNTNNHNQWLSQQLPPPVPLSQQPPPVGKAEQWRVPPLLSSSDWDAVASDSEDTWEQPYQSTSSAGNSSPTSGMISSHSCPSRTSYDLDNGGLALYSESLDSFDRAAAQLRTSRRPARMEDSFSTAGDEWRAPSASSSSSASLSAASFDSGHDGSLSLPRQRQQQGAAPLHPARRKDSDWFQHGHGDEALSRSADGNSGMGGGGPGLLDLLHLPLAAASLDSAAYSSSSSSSVRRPVGTARECGLEDLLAESLLLEEQRQGGRRDLSGDVQALFGPLSDPPARSQSSGEDSGYWHWDRRPGPSQLMRAGDTRTAHRSPFEPQSPLQRHSSSSSTMGRAVDRPPGFGDEADNQHHQQQQQHHHHHQQGGQSMSSRTALDAPPLLQEDSARRYPQPNTQQPSAGRGAYGTTLVPPGMYAAVHDSDRCCAASPFSRTAGPREAHLAASMGAPLEVTVRFHTSSSAGGGVIDVDPQTAAAMLGLLLQEGKQLQPQQKYQQQQLHLQPPKGSSLWATPSQGGHPNPPRHGLHGTTTTSMGLRLGPPPSSSSREQPMSREQLGGSLQSAPLQLPRDIPPPPPRNEYAPRKRAEQPPGLANSPLGSVNQRNPYQQQRNPYQQQCNQYQYDHQFDYHPHHHPQPPPQQQPPLRYPGPPCDMRTCN